jgi:hypothetical protein
MIHFGCTHFAEVDRLLRRTLLTRVDPGDNSQPDYLGVNFSKKLFVICEAKGSQSSMNVHKDQLDRGKEQVVNINPIYPGWATIRVVSAVLLSNETATKNTLWTVQDPPAREVQTLDVDPLDVVRLHYSSLLHFLGAPDTAKELETTPVKTLAPPPHLVKIQSRSTTVHGRLFPASLFQPLDERSFFVALDFSIANRWLAAEQSRISAPYRESAIAGANIPTVTASKFPDGGRISLGNVKL